MSNDKPKGSTVLKFMAWYQKLDKQTIDLLSRVFMKGMAAGDLNQFIKEMCARELGETLDDSRVVSRVIDTQHEDEEQPSTKR